MLYLRIYFQVLLKHFLHIGSMELLQQYPELVEDVVDGEIPCRKDTGETKKVRKWSRGYQFIVGGGGHIEAFTPLYQ